MSEKQTQQHRQHFNLSDETKQKLEELTARRYPGRQRRQSQLVEDLIMEAFEKERGMSTVSIGGVQEPEPGGLAPATREALDLAQQEARRLKAAEVSPEHLLLGLAEQGDSMTMRSLTSMRLDVPTLRDLLSGAGEQIWRIAEKEWRQRRSEEASTETETFSENLPLSAESQECLLRASSIAKRMGFSLVQPNHLLWGILLIKRIRDALTASRPLTEILSDTTVIVGFTEDEQARLSSCPFCGRSVQPHWKHCVYCGKSLARVCPKCGTPRAEAEGVRFCFECGSPLE